VTREVIVDNVRPRSHEVKVGEGHMRCYAVG